MSHQVALAFEDGVTRFITCEDGQTVADASYRARINIPLDCRDGACGTCKAVCESGEYDGGTYIDDALTAAEAAEGKCLPCSMTPRTDLVLQIASTSAVAKTRATAHTTRVTRVEQLSPTTVGLAVAAPSEGEELAFLPGQYVNITVPGTTEHRSYSFSSGPDADELTFIVKLTPGGLMSEYLAGRARPGDEITLTGPHGSFFLREAERPALLIAGGTGLAPVLSMVRKLVSESSDRQVHVVYGVSTDDDVVELEALSELSERLPHLTWEHCVSAPSGGSGATKGRVQRLITTERLHDGDVAVYVCGPPRMVEGVRAHLGELGVTPTDFYSEKFTPTAGADDAAPASADPGADVEEGGAGPEVEDLAPAEEDAADLRDEGPVTVQPRVLVTSGASALHESGARTVAGQLVWPRRELAPLRGSPPPSGDTDPRTTMRRVAGQLVLPPRTADDHDGSPLEPDVLLLEAREGRSVTGQEIWPSREVPPLHERPVDAPAGPQAAAARSSGDEVGDEHPGVQASDALFEARRALELGALELVIGRLSSQQVEGYRRLAELTLPCVDGDRFVDAEAYTETDAAFHDYLVAQTGDEHLLQAHQALGVTGQMAEALREATWCDPRCATDHLAIVDAVEALDRDAARTLITEHAERSRATVRRAMADRSAQRGPAFTSPGRFAGQVVLITGAAQGIGERVARRISAEGGAVVLADRSDLVGELASDLRRRGRSAVSTTADLETWEGAASVVEKAIAEHGRVDVSIHTVGGTIWAKPFVDYPPDQVEAEISRSLFPTLWSCRAVAPRMVEQGWGTIVNVSSVATRGLHRVPYAAAKGGVNAITASLAFELAPHGIRVVATAPGGTDAPARRIPRGPAPQTEQERSWYQTIVDQTVQSSLLKRYGTLDEQAAAICFLASREASYITATVLPVAGGDVG